MSIFACECVNMNTHMWLENEQEELHECVLVTCTMLLNGLNGALINNNESH